MSVLTKAEFKNVAEDELGYKSYKDLLVVLGYSKRYLDRFTMDQDLKEVFLSAFDDWLGENKTDDVSRETTDEVIEEKKPETVKPIEEKKVPASQVDESGIGIDVSNKIYHSSKNLSASKIKMIVENAFEFYNAYISCVNEKKYTDALMIGNLHHTLVLEPHNFDRDYIVLGLDGAPLKDDYVDAVKKLGGDIDYKENSKGEKVVADTVKDLKIKLDALREKEDRVIVTNSQLETAEKSSKKALESWYVIEKNNNELLRIQLKDLVNFENCHVERTFYGEIMGEVVQVRPDLLVNLGKNKDVWFVVDLKTAQDATYSMFAKQSAKFFYDVQEWVYREILRQNGINVVDFRFLVSGKSDDSNSAYYKVFSEDVQDAKKIVENAIKKFKYCKENNDWQEGRFDYKKMKFDNVSTVRLPAYRQHQLIDMGVI